MPFSFSQLSNDDKHLCSLGDFLYTFSAFWRLASKSLATNRNEEPPLFIKDKWALHALSN
jgi:hypothetical protein